jgi:hypothetical protein
VDGDGRTTTALLNEYKTGKPTGGQGTHDPTFHVERVLTQLNGYAKALRKSDTDRFHGGPGMDPKDEAVLRNLFQRSWDVLTSEDIAKAATADLDSRGVHGRIEDAVRKLGQNQAVSGETGAQFDEGNPREYQQTFRGYGGAAFLGRTLGVLGVAGDLQYAWEAGRVLFGQTPNWDLLPSSLRCESVGCATVS